MEKQLYSTPPAAQAKVKGVFSFEEIQRMGSGASMRKVRHKTYWFCQELEDGCYEAQPIGSNHIPAGPTKNLSRDEFLKGYTPEPAMYFSLVYPSMMELELTIARGDRYRNIKKYDRAEKEYDKALWIDEDNIRATFGLALTYLGMGDFEKANLIFERLVTLDGAFLPEHKHLFNEFGIKLRKNGLYSQAITYYSRALELTKDDENLFFNLARVYFHDGKPGNSLEYTMKAVDLNPGLDPAVKLLHWIVAKELVPAKKREKAVAFLERKGLSRTAAAPFLEEDLDASFLDTDETIFLLDDTNVSGTVRPLTGGKASTPGYNDAETVKRITMLKEELSQLMQAHIANQEVLPGDAGEAQRQPATPSEPSAPLAPSSGKTSSLHRKKRMSAVRAVRRRHKE